jgi:hypothetical protein
MARLLIRFQSWIDNARTYPCEAYSEAHSANMAKHTNWDSFSNFLWLEEFSRNFAFNNKQFIFF